MKSRPRCPPMPRWSPGSISHPRDRTRPIPTASTGAWSSAPEASRPGSQSREPVRTGCGPKTTPGLRTGSARSCANGPVPARPDLRPLVEKLRAQRIEPLAKALGASADGLPPARRLIVLPSRAMAGIPIEALLALDDTRTVSYAPSATVFKYLREQPRPDRHAGLLALGDPVYERPDASSEPKPLPDHGLLVNVVAPARTPRAHGLNPGDVLLAYNGHAPEQEG